MNAITPASEYANDEMMDGALCVNLPLSVKRTGHLFWFSLVNANQSPQAIFLRAEQVPHNRADSCPSARFLPSYSLLHLPCKSLSPDIFSILHCVGRHSETSSHRVGGCTILGRSCELQIPLPPTTCHEGSRKKNVHKRWEEKKNFFFGNHLQSHFLRGC